MPVPFILLKNFAFSFVLQDSSYILLNVVWFGVVNGDRIVRITQITSNQGNWEIREEWDIYIYIYREREREHLRITVFVRQVLPCLTNLTLKSIILWDSNEGGIVNNTLRPPIPERCDPEWRKLMEDCWSPDPSARPSFTEITNRLGVMSKGFHQKRHSQSKTWDSTFPM